MFLDCLTGYELASLKSGARILIDRVGGFDAAEDAAGRKRAQLHAYTDMASPAFIPADVIARLERAAAGIGVKPLVSPRLASLVGHVQVPIPNGEGELNREMAAAVRSAAEAAATLVEASADGVVTDAERAQIAVHAEDLVAAAMRLRASLAGPKLPIGRLRVVG